MAASFYLLCLAPAAMAQYSSSSFLPGATPTSSNGNNNNGNNNNMDGPGLSTYYAVGLALLLCCVAIALFFMFRRRALDRRAIRRDGGRAFALQRDLGGAVIAGDPSRGRGYLIGLRRPAVPEPEEGLNEQGEAPPQYISKREWEETHGSSTQEGGPSIPLQTLSHDAAGLRSKPPDYTETSTHEVNPNASTSIASGSIPRSAGQGTGS